MIIFFNFYFDLDDMVGIFNASHDILNNQDNEGMEQDVDEDSDEEDSNDSEGKIGARKTTKTEYKQQNTITKQLKHNKHKQ